MLRLRAVFYIKRRYADVFIFIRTDVNTRRGGKNAGAARYVYNVFAVPVRQIVQQSVN